MASQSDDTKLESLKKLVRDHKDTCYNKSVCEICNVQINADYSV
jgi:hypothetical protein